MATPTRPIAACILVSALVAFGGGVLFEHYLGANGVIDWTGLRDLSFVHRTRSTADRSPATLPASPPGRTMVALVFGQSNAGNGGETPGPPHPGVYELYRGRIYRAADPLLGAAGEGGSIWLRFAAKAIASGAYDAVVLVPFALGSANVARFAPGGGLHGGLMAAIAGAREQGLTFTHLLWQQGEMDAMMRTSGEAYREQFGAMLASIRRAGVDAPIYVARATRCARSRPSTEIGNAQSGLVDPASGILAGPDMDQLGFAERYDGCHFSTEGLERAAQLWQEAVRAGKEPSSAR